MLSYCTIAFFKGDTSYKLTCPSTATHAIHCPCHLLRQPLRPFDLYCTPHNNGCATSRWKKNHQNPQWCFVEGQQIHLGCLWLGWFRVYSPRFGWQLKRFEVCSCRQRLYETTAEPDGIRVLKDHVGVFRRFGFPFRVGSQILKFKRRATCHIMSYLL